MKFTLYGEKSRPTLFLLHGLGVSHEIFLPLIERLKDHFYIIAACIDGFILGEHSKFTSVDDQAMQANRYVQENLGGRLDIAYGLSLGGKILSRMMERSEIVIDHAIMDAAPLLPLPKWSVNPLRYYQCPSTRCGTTSAPMSGPATIGPDSGAGCSIRTISMSCWMNARKSIRTAAGNPFWTDIRMSIRIS